MLGRIMNKAAKQALKKLTGDSTLTDYKQLSRAIANNIENRQVEFIIKYKKKELKDLYKDIEYAIDFLDTISPYDFRNISTYSYQLNDLKAEYELNFYMSYHTSYTDEKFVEKQVEEIAQQLRKPGQTDFDIAKAIHDYIVINYSYSESTEHSPYIVFTILLEKSAVCQAYALLALKLFKQFGIPCLFVTGYANNGRHGWNLVQIDGSWYHLDVTWDDPVYNLERFENQRIDYRYFLLTDTQIMKDHDFDTLYYPPASNERFNMFHCIKRSIQIGDHIYFSNEMDNDKLYLLDTKLEPFEIKKVLDVRVQFLSYFNDTLYFSNYSNRGFLYSLNIKSLTLNQLNSFEIKNIVIEDSYIYVQDSQNKLKRIEIQNHKKDRNTSSKQKNETMIQHVILEKFDFSYYANYKNTNNVDTIYFKSTDDIELIITEHLPQITLEIIIDKFVEIKMNCNGELLELKNDTKLKIPIRILKIYPNQLLAQLPTKQLHLADYEIDKEFLTISVKMSQQFFIT